MPFRVHAEFLERGPELDEKIALCKLGHIEEGDPVELGAQMGALSEAGQGRAEDGMPPRGQ